MMVAYYNEIDPNAAEWLRQLIKLGAIAPGDVDERSIEHVPPIDLKPYTQLHFFAGVGAWSYALRQAGWPDNSPVWTGSCPCQPYSDAGKRTGTADERHLWPAMFWHIQQLRPSVVLGEQVASSDALGWWDIVASDLESQDYACTAFDLCAAGVGAPHIRQRLFWVADSLRGRQHRWRQVKASLVPPDEELLEVEGLREDGRLANADGAGREWPGSTQSERGRGKAILVGRSEVGRVDDPSQQRPQGGITGVHESKISQDEGAAVERAGFWDDAEWLPCSDGKYRPVKPGIFPLAHGIAPDLVRGGNSGIQAEKTQEARTMRLKGYGNAIVAPLAIKFIQSVMEVL